MSEDRMDKVVERVLETAEREGYIKLWSDVLKNEIKKRTPVDTGWLKASISSSFDGVTGEMIEFSAESVVEYAWYIENGTEKMSAFRMFELGSLATEEIIEEDLGWLFEYESASIIERSLRKIMSKL